MSSVLGIPAVIYPLAALPATGAGSRRSLALPGLHSHWRWGPARYRHSTPAASRCYQPMFPMC